MWQSLPRDVVHLILKFDGRIVYRTGQYLNRITPADPRYDMLLYRLPRKCFSYSFTQVNLVRWPQAFNNLTTESTKGAQVNLDRNSVRTMTVSCNTKRCISMTGSDHTVEFIYSYVNHSTNSIERMRYYLH